MESSDFILSSQVVIKLEKIDTSCIEVFTEVPLIVKQEPELDIETELPDEKKTKEIKRKSGAYPKTYCHICNVTLSSNQSFNYHNHAFHSNKPKPVFSCQLCPRTFPQPNFLKSHLRSHKEKNIFECDICGKSNLNRLKLQRHMAMHRKLMLYQCDMCPKAFKSKKYISRHVVTHIGEFCGFFLNLGRLQSPINLIFKLVDIFH